MSYGGFKIKQLQIFNSLDMVVKSEGKWEGRTYEKMHRKFKRCLTKTKQRINIYIFFVCNDIFIYLNIFHSFCTCFDIEVHVAHPMNYLSFYCCFFTLVHQCIIVQSQSFILALCTILSQKSGVLRMPKIHIFEKVSWK